MIILHGSIRRSPRIRDTISAVYEELFQEEPVFEAIHAGLECGILSGKIKELDCVSFGPNNYDIHTPKERLSIPRPRKYGSFWWHFKNVNKKE